MYFIITLPDLAPICDGEAVFYHADWHDTHEGLLMEAMDRRKIIDFASGREIEGGEADDLLGTSILKGHRLEKVEEVDWSKCIMGFILQERPIPAIKLIRELSGYSLKGAKDWVDGARKSQLFWEEHREVYDNNFSEWASIAQDEYDAISRPLLSENQTAEAAARIFRRMRQRSNLCPDQEHELDQAIMALQEASGSKEYAAGYRHFLETLAETPFLTL